jgi:Spy/CpxP family protein refolding chaperone
MRRFFSAALIGAALASGSVIAAAQANGPARRPELRQGDTARVWQRDSTGRRNGRRGPGMMDRAALQGIQLTAAQKTSLQAIHKNYRDQMQQLRQANGGQAQSQPKGPNAELRARVKTLAENERKDIRAILTPDQQKQFDANVVKLQNRQGKGKGHRDRQ